MLAVLYFRELRLDPDDADWADRDRFVLSTGHYSIGMYAALAEYGYLPVEELNTYGMAGSRLPMSTFDDLPGIEMVGGSLGHGLGQGVGMALAAKLDERDVRVVVELSDGELQEGSTWEAAMSAATFNLDQLVVVVDCNGIQADGPVKLCGAFDVLREANSRPKAIVMRTVPGKGIPTLEARERAHFVRTEAGEWDKLAADLERAA